MFSRFKTKPFALIFFFALLFSAFATLHIREFLHELSWHVHGKSHHHHGERVHIHSETQQDASDTGVPEHKHDFRSFSVTVRVASVSSLWSFALTKLVFVFDHSTIVFLRNFIVFHFDSHAPPPLHVALEFFVCHPSLAPPFA